MTHKIFPYSWHIDDQQQERTVIRIYGLNEKNQSISVTIKDFTPYIYLELPEDIEWNETRANMLGKKIDDICGKFRPLKKCLSIAPFSVSDKILINRIFANSNISPNNFMTSLSFG